MKKTKKLIALLLTLAMTLALGMSAFAADTGTITINNATEGNTYKVYKVFDAVGNGTNISYKLVDGKTFAPSGFTVDGAGNVTYAGIGIGGELTADDIAAIAGYVTEADLVDTVVVSEGGTSVTTKALENGYYYITTTTGAAVTIDSTNPNVTVEDKNDAPVLDKTITGVDDGSMDDAGKNALAQVGTTVSYKATITVGNGAKDYVFHDVMSTGLAYNNDVTVTLNDDTTPIEASADTFSTAIEAGDTITLTFNNTWIAEHVDDIINIAYSATVTSDAVTVDSARNTASIDYGDNNTVALNEDDIPEVYTAKLTVTKVDGNGDALAGAGFVLSKGTGSDTLYYTYDETNGVGWVSNIDDATEYTTVDGVDGNIVTFNGLADGTYTLVEKTVPAGYNKAIDYTFTISANNYTTTNLAQATTVTNNTGAELPTTGGMGTTLFYVIGAILVIGAAVVLVARRRMHRG